VPLSIRLRPAVEDEVVAAMAWYIERVPGLETDFYRSFLATLRLLAEHPQMFAEVDPPVRRALLKGFPYAVFYVVETTSVVVLACVHERRSPERWPQI